MLIFRNIFVTIIFIFVVSFWGNAQNDTTIHLRMDELEVKGKRKISETALSLTKIDSMAFRESVTSSLAEMLSSHSPLYVKSAGTGQLSTVSFRGTAASHTQVEWNGININNPMLGQVDFSSLPVWFIDGAELLHGASSLSEGSGSLGGSVKLSSKPHWGDNLYGSVMGSVASFNSYQTFAEVGGGSENFQARGRFMYNTSKNNFEFLNNAILPNEYMRQQNADFKKIGGALDLFYKNNNGHLFSLNSWMHVSDRSLPTVMSYQGKGREETQDDSEFRIVGSWAKYSEKYVSKLNVGYTYTSLDYYLANNTDLGVVVNNNSLSNIGSLFNNYRFEYNFTSKTMLRVLANVDYHKVNTDNRITSEGYREDRLQAGASVGIHQKIGNKVTAYLLMREELVDNSFSPIMPSIGVEYLPFNKIDALVKFNISRNYHYPTLNDLYWIPGGNPDLRPERGFMGDMTAEYKLKLRQTDFNASITGYLSKIDDWIEWRPSEYRYWVASNIKSVFARGLEASAGFTQRYVCGVTFAAKASYAYTRTTNQSDENVKGKQLIYIPENKINLMGELTYRGFFLNYLWNFISERYTTVTNETYRHMLPSYDLHNLGLGKKFIINNYSLTAEFKINNLLNENYQAIQWRAMPRRNYQATIRWNF